MNRMHMCTTLDDHANSLDLSTEALTTKAYLSSSSSSSSHVSGSQAKSTEETAKTQAIEDILFIHEVATCRKS